MQKKSTNNRGFSLVELIIVVAILAVLIGILAPQYLKYVERAKRVKDANTALEMRNAFDRVLATDPSAILAVGSTSAQRSDNGNYVAAVSTDGSGFAGCTDPLLLAVMDDLGSYPLASTYKSGAWVVEIDKTYFNVVRIEIFELTPSGPHLAGSQVLGYEVWPNSHAFYSCSEPTPLDAYNNSH